MSSSKSVEMPFLEHLEELRWRLFKCAVAIALGVGVAFALLYSKKVDIMQVEPEVGKHIRLDNIFFDFDKNDVIFLFSFFPLSVHVDSYLLMLKKMQAALQSSILERIFWL